jgi:hypothetical protein
MSNHPTIRYLTGYIIRLILGTVVVLCAISAARTFWLAPALKRPPSAPWDRILNLADTGVYFCVARFSPGGKPLTMQPDSPDSKPSQAIFNFSGKIAGKNTDPRMPDMPHMQNDIDSPSMPAMPNMPSMHDMSGGAEAPPLVTPTPDAAPSEYGWGVTCDPETRIYNEDGKLLGRVPPGSLLKVLDQKQTKEGDLIICSIVLDGRKLTKAIVRSSEAVLYPGNLSDTTEKVRSLCVRHAQILAEIENRKHQLRKEAAGNNPHASTYKQAYREYKEFAEKVNSTRKEYESSTGAKRMKIADELRELKVHESQIVSTYQTEKKKYTAWKRNNSSGPINVDADPKVQQMQKDLSQLEQQLMNL